MTAKSPTVRGGIAARQMALGILFQIPALVTIAFTMLIPLVWNLVLSFFSWNGNGPMRFVGLENYLTVLSKRAYYTTYHHTLSLAMISTAFGLLLGLSLAVMIYRAGKREGAFYRFVLFSPSIIPMTVVGLIFSFILSPEMGLVNNFLKLVGLGGLARPWLADPNLVIRVLGLIQGWRFSGIIMMLFYTSMLSIPASLIEASVLDGCNYARQLRHLILPILKPTLQLSLSMLLINSFKSYDVVQAMTSGGPGSASKVVSLKMIEAGFGNNQFGVAGAVAILLTLIVTAFLLVGRRVTRGETYEF